MPAAGAHLIAAFHSVTVWLPVHIILISGYTTGIPAFIKDTTTSRLTVVSREVKKKQHACASSGSRDHYSELFTRMAALKF